MAITPSTKIKVGLPVIEIKYLAKQNEMDYEEVLKTIHEMLLYVLDELIPEIEEWINDYVPMDTGRLRQSLIRELKTSSVKKGLMRIILGTFLSYAEDVAEYSTMQVRHDKDPEAIGNFWEELQKFAKERCMSILQRAIDEYFKGTGKLMRMVRGRM